MTEPTIKNYPNIAQSFGITGILVLAMFVFLPVDLVLDKMIGKEASMLIYYLFVMGIPLWIFYSIRKKKTGKDSFDLTLKNSRIIPLVILAAMAFDFGIISPIVDLIPMPEIIKELFIEFASLTGVFGFILVVIAAPILEEIVFRGIILDGLLKIYSPVKSILISSLLFGLVHLNPWQFIGALIIGVFSGWVYYRTRSLLPSIIIPSTLNLSGFLVMSFSNIESLMNDGMVKIYGGVTNYVFVIVGSIIIGSISIYYLKKEFRRGGVEMAAHNNT